MTITVLAQCLQILGLILDLVGVLQMANGYTRALPQSQIAFLLVNALRRGPLAKEAVQHQDLTREDRMNVLQGLAFVGLGFLLQISGVILLLLFSPAS